MGVGKGGWGGGGESEMGEKSKHIRMIGYVWMYGLGA